MPVSIRGQFQRSIHLARDFYSERDLSGYIITAKARETLGRFADALASPGTQRAWSITGPYGGGKSAFALFATHLLRGNEEARKHLTAADEALGERILATCKSPFCPVLVVGSREPLEAALLRSLAEALSGFAASLHNKRGRPPKSVALSQEALRTIASEAQALSDPSDGAVLDLFERASAAVHTATGGGIFLVIDELGKLLEYAALYPERGDLFLLQSLAERASRATAPSGAPSPPILVVSILHQAFDRYASHLTRSQRDEWRKVQGRYEDISFVEPVGETLRLLAHAIEVEQESEIPEHGIHEVDKLLSSAHLPPHLDITQVRSHLIEALPLSPAVSLLVGPLFRRLAQNERSLFAFLAAGEPYSFMDIARRESQAPPGTLETMSRPVVSKPLPIYRLDHLYDYLTTTLSGALFNDHVGRLWAETETALTVLARGRGSEEDDQASTESLAERLLKHIAILSFAGSLAGLPPTRDILVATVDAEPQAVGLALDRLVDAKAVIFRRTSREYRIWEGSDFDLDAALQEAREHIPLRTPLAQLLATTTPATPIVARRHSYRTGATRVFEAVYVSDEEWTKVIEQPLKHADGRVMYVIRERDENPQTLLNAIKEATGKAAHTDLGRLTVVAVPRGTSALREAVRELACLDWVRTHVESLKGDATARREVDEQRADLATIVRQRLTSLVSSSDATNCTWIYCGTTLDLDGDRSLQSALSGIADAVFEHSPEIWNELLNRRKPSSSAIRGQKLLLKAMLERPGEPRLGIEGHPAEFGLYASILKAPGLHRFVDGKWAFIPPDPRRRPGCAAVWRAIERRLRDADGEPVAVSDIFEHLRRPPYGVREGLLPIFLFAVYVRLADDIAVYEDGVFIRNLEFEAVERLLRQPSRFSFQLVELDIEKADVLREIAPIVGISVTPGSHEVPKPLPVVLRVLGRASGLPPYVGRTTELSDVAIAVREALFAAREPATLLFHDLPLACGVGSFLRKEYAKGAQARAYADQLSKALRELSGAYDSLLLWIQEELTIAFHLHARTSDERRRELAERARVVQRVAVEPKLRSFVVRVADTILDTQGWYESVAALLAKRPPAQWTDEDRRTFGLELRDVTRLFHHREAIAFDAYREEDLHDGSDDGTDAKTRVERVRVSITTTFEEERETVLSIHREDWDLVESVIRRLKGAMSHGDETIETKLAALSQLSRHLMQKMGGSDVEESIGTRNMDENAPRLG